MPVINGTSGNNTLQGTNEDDTINALGGQDLVSGEGGDDSILGGNGNDTLFGDVGEGTTPGNDASPLIISSSNRVTSNESDNDPGDFAVYKNVAQLEDGTQVSARVTLVSKSDEDLAVDPSGSGGAEILMNGNGTGDTASFAMEFFIPDSPNATTGTPVALNSTATVKDLDRNSPGDQDAWFSASFENREFIQITLAARTSNSGFSFSGDLIDDPIVTPIETGDDTIKCGSEQDLIFGQGGDDSLLGAQGNDTLDGGEGDDTLEGGSGRDSLEGGLGADLLAGGRGDDVLLGGAGADRIVMGPDNDRGEGGTGSHMFTFDGIGNHRIIGGEDPDGLDIDVIDLTGIRANVIQTGPESGTIELLEENGDVARRVEYSEIEQIICFTPGTRIATQKGEVPVEELQAGVKVFTRNNGAQTLRWVGRRDLSPRTLHDRREFQPILIRKGALGKGLPERDLLVSAQHRMLVASDLAALMFDEREVLVAAKHLVGLDGVDAMRIASVSYLHLMFDHHEVVLADGAWSESFQPGDMSLRGIGTDQRDEVLRLFPELETIAGLDAYGAARLSLKRHEAKIIVDRFR